MLAQALRESRRLPIQEGNEERIWMKRPNPEGCEHGLREVSEVEGHDHRRLCRDGGRKHVPVILVGQCEGGDESFVTLNQALGIDLVHQGARPLQLLASQVGAVGENRAGPLLVDGVRPARLVDRLRRQPEKDIAQGGGIEDTRPTPRPSFVQR